MEKEKEVIKSFFDGLKFILYNDYENLNEFQNDFGEISTYVMNIIIGFFEYLKKHTEVAEYIKKNYSDVIKIFYE